MDTAKVSIYRLKNLFFNRNFQHALLAVIFFVSLTYSFSLAYKRYVNFEFGKFDLGNMTQMVWNTSNGKFMEVTDQFGTNMPRWGMSHVDPILLVFVPIFFFFAHPMLLVFFQHVLVLSAIFPIYKLVNSKTNSILASILVVLSYILYPALGFILVWTEYHGISFVAPIFIWFIWYLDKNNFFKEGMSRAQAFTYWGMIVFMLLGKEEIGAILGLYAVFMYFSNKRLAIKTFIVSFLWTLICFLLIIPSYSDLREQSIDNFLERVNLNDEDAEFVSGSNFFLHRYSYLGDSYGEIAINAALRPDKILKEAYSEDKVEAINQLFGPLGYVVLLSPIWLISIPDLAIVLLSKDEIFSISNHRISFVISSLFVSYIYLLNWISLKFKPKGFVVVFAALIFLLNLYFSALTANPLYQSGKSLLTDKILAKVMAQELEEQDSLVRKSKVPRNYNLCLEEMVEIINKVNPNIYTGPDYLGAHASMREVNALFPSRYWDADLVIADFFETKTFSPFGGASWSYNKESLRRMMDMNDYRHLYSCGKMTAYVKGDGLDSATLIPNLPDGISEEALVQLETPKVEISFLPVFIPSTITRLEPTSSEYIVRRDSGSFHDKAIYWIFEKRDNPEQKFYFIDHISISSREGVDYLDLSQLSYENYHFILPKSLETGTYKMYFGVGDLLEATDIYVQDVEVL